MNLINNGGFETGSLWPWQGMNASIHSMHLQTGYFCAELAGGMIKASIQQIVPVEPHVSYLFSMSIAKSQISGAPLMSMFLLFLDHFYQTASVGFANSMRIRNQPQSETGAWKTIVESTTESPPNAAYALLCILKAPQQASSAVLVDDIGLYLTGGGGGSGVDYTEIRNLLTSYQASNTTIVIMTSGQQTGAAAKVTSVGATLVTLTTLAGSTMSIPYEHITNIETV
ncbi:NTTRR-F1 domain [Brevibacillus invocatus]|uniref:NTTRR-F1 domain n=1 Tax=Brevibacillus invocatus TaxID=173959 RepID=UPI0023EE6D47|nr:NTTRR-F1 domain [Brevibacillus invocatus]